MKAYLKTINLQTKLNKLNGYKAMLLALLLLLLTVACQPEEVTISIVQPPELIVDTSSTDHPTLDDFWTGSAEFKLTIPETGLPMGESETIIVENGDMWSYVHASDRSAGTIDQCGAPVEFPGCTVIYYSTDGGDTFRPEDPPICIFECTSCPCESHIDHTDQQQYPDVAFDDNGTMYLVYEFHGSTQLRTSTDGQNWSDSTRVSDTGQFRLQDKLCPTTDVIGSHPFEPPYYDCLAGGPPGIFIEGEDIYVFVGLGKSTGSMGCFRGKVGQDAGTFTRCQKNPLFVGASEYGDVNVKDARANKNFDFKTITSADTIPLGSGADKRYYMLYEGVRGPGPGDPGDTQFGLGLARSLTNQIDGPWEKYSLNPILVDNPANIGIGHGDLLVKDGKTILYTSVDGVTRSRLDLVWKAEEDIVPPNANIGIEEVPLQASRLPTIADFWDKSARFSLEIANSGLPLGESDTIITKDGEWWSYVHASQQSAGVIDQCGDPVPFPGCTVIYKSDNEGQSFVLPEPGVCQFGCDSCPCYNETNWLGTPSDSNNHTNQQQYPDVNVTDEEMYIVYEFQGQTFLRTSEDGLYWGSPTVVGQSGHWKGYACNEPSEVIGDHPFIPKDYECLAGAPPAVYVEDGIVYVFMAMGQNPGHMGCFKGSVGQSADEYKRCDNNPLITGASEYGPLEVRGAAAHAYFDFKTISSAEIYPVDTDAGRRYYMIYEGIRGPGPGDYGDTQFALGLARTTTDQLDGPWEKYDSNPILVDMPGNVGLGHADLVVHQGQTYLYTSLDGVSRSRLKLIWNNP